MPPKDRHHPRDGRFRSRWSLRRHRVAVTSAASLSADSGSVRSAQTIGLGLLFDTLIVRSFMSLPSQRYRATGSAWRSGCARARPGHDAAPYGPRSAFAR